MQSEEFIKVIDYILTKAGEPELAIIRGALEKRSGTSGTSKNFSMNFHEMAKKMAGELQAKFIDSGNIHDMTKRLVANMILQQAPNISPEELAILLDEWVPSQKKMQKKAPVPPDMMLTMIGQFLDYSLGRMKSAELRELDSLPGWQERYWNAFSENVQDILKKIIQSQIPEKQGREMLVAVLLKEK